MSKLLKRAAERGFTLIELMIVVAIIGILAAIAIPKFADLITKSKESSAKGSLGALRSAVSIYYSDTEGIFPVDMAVGLTSGNKYLDQVPGVTIPPVSMVSNPGHVNSKAIRTLAAGAINEAGGWYYNSGIGTVQVNCAAHLDTKGSTWSLW